jgi:hypothetical protein
MEDVLQCGASYFVLIESRKMRWARHMARIGEERKVCTRLW